MDLKSDFNNAKNDNNNLHLCLETLAELNGRRLEGF